MSDRKHVPVVGIVGGIGSGKSAVCRWLSDQGRAAVINGDELGHQVLGDPSIQDQIRRRFGDTVFRDTGEIDRGALGREVFGPGDRQQRARADLERIVHPGIRKGIEREIARARSAGQVEVILLDAAVLFEAGWNDLCNAVFYVHVPDEVRLERVTRTRGWDEAELKKREASQWSLADKQSRADGVVDNSGSLEEAGAQLERLVRQLIHDSSPPSNE